jgi:integrase/recombinase XerD
MEMNQLTVTELINATRRELLKTGYTYLSLIERTWLNLEEYVQKLGIIYFSKEVGKIFLEERYHHAKKPHSHSNTDRLRAIQLLEDFQAHQKIFIRRISRTSEIAEPFESLFCAFMEFRKNNGISGRTLESYRIYLRRFSQYLLDHAVTDVIEIEVLHIHGFIQATASSYRIATVYCTSCLLRVLFRYLLSNLLITKDLALFVPAVKCNKKSTIPSAYSQDEIRDLLACVDRGNPKGKRDYAILLIAVRLGIRASDICGLTFDNFKWESNTIELIQGKTDKTIVLPLLNDVGEAVIDYIKYGRPTVEGNEVFLRLSAPIERMRAPTLHSIVTQYMKKAGIQIPEGKKHGPHSLRHSLASALLHNNTPMPVISEILGHTDSNTTSVYLKIDTLHLREFALNVPPVKMMWLGGTSK